MWFECLQLCHSLGGYEENLKKSSSFYEDWGDVTQIKFDHWWKEKKNLFEDTYVSEVERVSKNPNIVTLSIPLDESVSTILKDVKKIVEDKQTQRLIDKGIDPTDLKSKKLSVGKYSFTQKEIKGKPHYINLEVFKLYLRLGRPPINRNFLIELRTNFDSRKRSQLSKNIVYIPTLRDFEVTHITNGDCEDIIRVVRRGIRGVEKTLLNVSNGKFP
ncbi:MAG: hypothetical protein VW270_14845 [Candidatus Poseidoniales archaeon]